MSDKISPAIEEGLGMAALELERAASEFPQDFDHPKWHERSRRSAAEIRQRLRELEALIELHAEVSWATKK